MIFSVSQILEWNCCRKCGCDCNIYSLIDVDGRVLTNISYLSSSSLKEFLNLFIFCRKCSARAGLLADDICDHIAKKYHLVPTEIFSLGNIRSLIAPRMAGRRLIRHLAKHSTKPMKIVLTQYRQVVRLPLNCEKFLSRHFFSECGEGGGEISKYYWPECILTVIFDFFYE